MLPEKFRLKKRSAFAATYKTGTTFHSGGITVFCGKLKKNGDTRIGFVVSKKVHKRAVKRNRIRRLMRESVRLYIKSLGNFDTQYMSLIFVGSTKLLGKDYRYIDSKIKELMGRL